MRLQGRKCLQIDDIRVGVELNWISGETDKHPVLNELDVMVIFCKAEAKIKDISKVMYEIEQYSRRLGGIYYYPALVLTATPDQKMKRRADLTHVKLFLPGERFSEELDAWLKQENNSRAW